MKTRKFARSAITGRYISLAEAKRTPSTSVIETLHVLRSGARRLERRPVRRGAVGEAPETTVEFKAGRDL